MENLKFNFEDLKVYQKFLDFVDQVYETIRVSKDDNLASTICKNQKKVNPHKRSVLQTNR